MAQEKKQSFMKGAVILSASTLLVKSIGIAVLYSAGEPDRPKEHVLLFYAAYDIFGFFPYAFYSRTAYCCIPYGRYRLCPGPP